MPPTRRRGRAQANRAFADHPGKPGLVPVGRRLEAFGVSLIASWNTLRMHYLRLTVFTSDPPRCFMLIVREQARKGRRMQWRLTNGCNHNSDDAPHEDGEDGDDEDDE